MRDYGEELKLRSEYVRKLLLESGAKGVVLGNSGGKDSALVAAICRAATESVLGVIMPCGSIRNYGEDRDHALEVAEKFGIQTIEADLTPSRDALLGSLQGADGITPLAAANIAPRLRMTALYALAHTKGYLVAGTGNRSEIYMGYFTKHGDGAYDFNPAADLTVTEVYEFLRFLNAPECVLKKAPSAGLFEGQTDETEMGVTYREIDSLLLKGERGKNYERIERAHAATAHKRKSARIYPD